MKSKKRFLHKKADKRLRRFELVIHFALLLMGGVVLYDSFQHDLPFYYILFMIAGAFAGRVYVYTHRVEFEQESLEISLSSNRWSLVLLILVIVIRFLLGKQLLVSFNVIWVGDALYLFFMGVYQARWKGIVRQIDEIYYNLILRQNE